MLAKAIVSEPDLLILDEPTNHLDIPSILWLETFLCSLEVALLFVTHDRFLLDSVATKIIELDRNELYVYPSGYGSFLKLRNKRWQDEELKSVNLIKSLQKRRHGSVRVLKQEERAMRDVFVLLKNFDCKKRSNFYTIKTVINNKRSTRCQEKLS